MKEKIIVTGGSGFIGTNLIEELIRQGYEVINIDIKEPQIKTRNNVWKQVDIKDLENLRKIFRDFSPKYVIHLAARTDLTGKRIEDYSSNTIGVENVLKCCLELESLEKVVVTSSMLVCKTGYYPKNQYDYAPSTLYGKSKVISEENVWKIKPNCDWAIIRPTSIWGPWFDVPYRNFFDMVINKRYFHIGNKSCTKTYGYIGNAVYQIIRIMFSDTRDENNKVFYIGDYKETNIEEWANEIAEEIGYKILRVPYWVMKCAACLGDMLQGVGMSFPMTSFRLKNMTTNNVIDLQNTEKIVGKIPYTRRYGIKQTLKWMKKKNSKDEEQ